jgi:hypothetical protein
VVDRVAGFGLAGGLGVEDLELAGHLLGLLRRPTQTHESGTEVLDIGLQHGRRVAIGVDRDEHPLQARAVATQRAPDLRQLGHRGRTHVRALRVAEEHHHHLAFEVAQGPQPAVGIGQLQLARVLRARDVDRSERRLRPRRAGTGPVAPGNEQGAAERAEQQGQPISHRSHPIQGIR